MMSFTVGFLEISPGQETGRDTGQTFGVMYGEMFVMFGYFDFEKCNWVVGWDREVSG